MKLIHLAVLIVTTICCRLHPKDRDENQIALSIRSIAKSRPQDGPRDYLQQTTYKLAVCCNDDETNEPFEKGHLRYVGMVRESRLGNSLD